MDAVTQFLRIFIISLLSCSASAIKCYYCDNSVTSACGKDFKAYQFEAISCTEREKPRCGKQEQPPDKNGWVGVIRSCYYSGDLPSINETNGCHHYFHESENFTALYCFCDTSFCNGAPPTFTMTWSHVTQWAWFFTISALICHVFCTPRLSSYFPYFH